MSETQQERAGAFDVAVIGGGPAGLFATFYAGLRGMRAVVIDAAPQLGGQVAALYPEKWIYDVGGFARVRGQELVRQMVEQAKRFDPEIRLETRVTTVEGGPEKGERAGNGSPLFRLRLSSGESLQARGVIVAAGVGGFQPRRLPAPGLSRWEGRGLTYFVRSLEDMRGKRVVVVGGGDTAVDWALMLVDVASEVTLVHRRNEFRALEESVENLRRSPVQLKLSAEVVAAAGEDHLERVGIRFASGETEDMPTDVLLGCLGFQADLGPIAEWGLDMEKNTIRTDHMGRTSRPGIYAVGDIATYEGKLKLIATGFSEAAMAVAHLKTVLEPKASLQPAHSSSLKLA